MRSAPCARSHASAASDWATASSGGLVRDFSATTTASAGGTAIAAAGTPFAWITDSPSRASVTPRSVAPVRSSAMQPRSMAASYNSSRGITVVSDGT